MRFWFSLLIATSAAILTTCLAQTIDTKDRPENRGAITGENIYHNPALGLTLTLPGKWQVFDRTMYSTPEQKQKEKELEEKARATCQGPLCGKGEIDVSIQSPPAAPPVYSVYFGAHKLTPEYQNRERHPLKGFAEVMSLGSLGGNWVPEGGLTAIQLGGRPAYRLTVHNKQVITAKGFLYVADSNGLVFMLLAVAKSNPEELQSAVENLQFINSANPTN